MPTITKPAPEPLRYSTAETARYIRHLLKQAWPRQKFSVRSSIYAGGSSIYVHWVDGPTARQVDAITDPLEGSGFDGMTDCQYNKYRYVDRDGSIVSVEKRSEIPQGRTEVQFCVDYITASRRFSRATVESAAVYVASHFCHRVPAVAGTPDDAYIVMPYYGDLGEEIMRQLHEADFTGGPVA